jgi:hypothetical protein
MKRKILVTLLILLIAIQFIRPSKNLGSPVPGKMISSVVPVPDSVASILKVSCYDCHSNKTRYPWYAEVQPVGWWLQNHVKDGKRKLNLDDFGSLPLDKQIHKLKEVSETVEKGEMPLSSYLIIHRDAKLSPEQKKLVMDWAASSAASLTTAHP